MAEYLIQGDTLTAIANAIRSKTGTSGTITATNMANAINNIETGSGTNVQSGKLTINSASSAVAFNCNFTPSKIFLYCGAATTDGLVMTFKYDSSKTGSEFDYIYFDSTRNWPMSASEQANYPSDNPNCFITCYGNSCSITINNTVGHKFRAGDWYYVAIE